MSEIVPLTEVTEPMPLYLVRVTAPHNAEVERLCELGLTRGTRLLVVQNNGSPIVVLVGNSRLCLNREVARHLWVQREASL